MKQASFMNIALEDAESAARKGEVPVGAVIVKDSEIIARAHNLTRSNHDPCGHAEIVALREAAQYLHNERLEGCSLYVTLEPCPMCLAAISQARIARVYFGADDLKSGAISAGHNLLQAPALHHKPEIYDGIMEEQCRALLQEFFALLRKGERGGQG